MIMKCMRDGEFIPQNGHVEPKNDDLPMALALPYFKIKTQEVDHPVALYSYQHHGKITLQ